MKDGYGKADTNPNHAGDEFFSVFSVSFASYLLSVIVNTGGSQLTTIQ